MRSFLQKNGIPSFHDTGIHALKAILQCKEDCLQGIFFYKMQVFAYNGILRYHKDNHTAAAPQKQQTENNDRKEHA